MLILAIFAVALLTVLAVAITAAVRVELLASRTSLERLRALFLAEAGINQARAVLLYEDQNADTLQDPWGPNAEFPLDQPHELEVGGYRVRVEDACGRIDINQADYGTLMRLTGDAAVVDAIIDWREPQAEYATAGMQRPPSESAYQSLAHPYMPRNGPFQTIGELLLVRGMTPDLFYGKGDQLGLDELLTVQSGCRNTDADGNPRVGLNEFRNWSEEAFRKSVMSRLGAVLTMYDAEQIWQGLSILPGYQYTSLGQLATAAGLDADKIAQLVDRVTVQSGPVLTGRVNVNTARPEVLMALPGSSPAVAEAIVERREQQPFTSMGEVAETLFSQSEGPMVFAQMIDHLTTKSSTFMIESMGYTESGRFRTLRADVWRGPDAVPIVRQTEQDWPLPPLAEGTESVSTRRSSFVPS